MSFNKLKLPLQFFMSNKPLVSGAKALICVVINK